MVYCEFDSSNDKTNSLIEYRAYRGCASVRSVNTTTNTSNAEYCSLSLVRHGICAMRICRVVCFCLIIITHWLEFVKTGIYPVIFRFTVFVFRHWRMLASCAVYFVCTQNVYESTKERRVNSVLDRMRKRKNYWAIQNSACIILAYKF